MVWSATVYSAPPAVATVVSVAVAALAWRHRSEPAAKPLLALMLAVAGWSPCYAVQVGFGSLGAQLFWQRLGLSLGGTIPALWFLFILRIADDGPGITEHERQAVTAGKETALRHGTGVGLWLARWGVVASGGDLSFDDGRLLDDMRRAPEAVGTVVVLEFPTPEAGLRESLPADGTDAVGSPTGDRRAGQGI